MKRIILAALVGVLVSGPAWGAETDLMLICTTKVSHPDAPKGLASLDRYYILQPTKGKARVVTTDLAIEGELEVKENIFIMHFPEKGKYYEKLVEVNRYTGKLYGQFGSSPLKEGSLNNVYFLGTCKKTEPKRRF